MRKHLFASVAIAALAFGASYASAQTGRPEEKGAQGATKSVQPETKGASEKPGASGAARDNSDMKHSQASPGASGAGEKNAEQKGVGATERGKAAAEEKSKPSSPRSAEGAREEKSGGTAKETNTSPGRAATEHGGGKNAAERDRSKAGESKSSAGMKDRNADEKRAGQNEQTKPSGGMNERNAAGKGAGGEKGMMGSSESKGADANGGATAELDSTHQSRVREMISRRHVENVRANFDVSVGARVPEHVRPHPLPADVVDILPQRYRGDEFVMVNDEIVIVEPHTRKIVTVIGRNEGAGGGRMAHLHRLSIPSAKQRVVYRDVIRDAHPIRRRIDVEIGQRVPQDIELEPLPQMVFSEVPDVRDYRYFVVNREVVLVDPGTREVVEIIRE
jgi:hypothetical protein